jgi:hypothetical protein
MRHLRLLALMAPVIALDPSMTGPGGQPAIVFDIVAERT